MTKVLVISSEFDSATRIIGGWASAVYADKRLIGTEVTRENVEREIKDSDIVIIFSHAQTSNKILGYNKEIILDESNIGLLKDKKVFFITCRTTKLYSCDIFDTIVAFKGTFTFDVLYSDVYKKLIVEIANNFYKDDFYLQKFLKEYLETLKAYPQFTRRVIEKDIKNLVIKQKVGSIYLEVSFYPVDE